MKKLTSFLKDLVIAFIIASIITSIYIYIKIPPKAQYSFPGKLIPVTELIDDSGETNLFATSTETLLTTKRSHLLKYMWDKRIFNFRFTYIDYETTEKIVDDYIDSRQISTEKESEAIEAIVDFTFDRFDDDIDQIEAFLEPLTWYEDYHGDSATLIIMLYLIGLNENKAWVHAEQKIAVTASLDRDGNVLPVGAVSLKAIAARKNNADVFIVPKEQLEEAYQYINKNSRMEIIGVETIDEAIEWLDLNIKQ